MLTVCLPVRGSKLQLKAQGCLCQPEAERALKRQAQEKLTEITLFLLKVLKVTKQLSKTATVGRKNT